MALLAAALLVVVGVPFLLLWRFFLVPPANFPRNIPTIPFYVSLIPFFKDVDQKVIFEQYLAKPLADFGAVKYFFGARWNILVVRPDLVAEVFKNEDLYAKSGNHKKIPYSILADYTGDNVISAHGDNWRLYRSILKPGLQMRFDIEPIHDNAIACIGIIEKASDASTSKVVIPSILQRYALANLSQSLMSTTFNVSTSDLPLVLFVQEPNAKTDIYRRWRKLMLRCTLCSSQ